jgi:Domain of unknown function (DUF4173)
VRDRERLALGLLSISLVLGAGADVLFDGRAIGINAGLFTAAFVGALFALIRIGRVPLHQGRRVMAIPLVLFASLLAWHDSSLLLAANLIAIAGAFALGALRRTDRRVIDAQLSDYAVGAASAGAATFAGAFELLGHEVPWQEVRHRVRGRNSTAIARGFALGLPLLALFGGLFIAADAVFKSLLVTALPDVSRLELHLLIAVGFAWTSAGLLRDLLATRQEERVVSTVALPAPRRGLGAVEVATVLAALNVLFLAFVVVQLRYLFGGRDLVESRVHLTYAQYARHGFFELVAVAILVLPVLLAAHAVIRGRRARLVQAMSAFLIVLVMVVMASALQRMRLYQREYGLTELRIYATGMIVWLGFVFVWFGATVIRGRGRRFAVGVIAAGFVATLALNFANPDALIARTNLSRPHVDTAYLGGLSDDAVPTLLARLPTLDPALRRRLARALLARGADGTGVLDWNASRAHAYALLRSHRAELEALAAG